MKLFKMIYFILLVTVIPNAILFVIGIIKFSMASIHLVPILLIAFAITRISHYEAIVNDDDSIVFSSYKSINTIMLLLTIIILLSIIGLMQIKYDVVYIYLIFGILAFSIPLFISINSEMIISKTRLYINGEIFNRTDLQLEVNNDIKQIVVISKGKRAIVRNKNNIIEIKNRLINI